MRVGETLGRKRMVARMNCAAVPSGRCQPSAYAARRALLSACRRRRRRPCRSPRAVVVRAPPRGTQALVAEPARRFTSGFEKFADLFHQRPNVLFPGRVLCSAPAAFPGSADRLEPVLRGPGGPDPAASPRHPQPLRHRQFSDPAAHRGADFGGAAVVDAGVDAGLRHFPHEIVDARPAPRRAVRGRAARRQHRRSDRRRSPPSAPRRRPPRGCCARSDTRGASARR